MGNIVREGVGLAGTALIGGPEAVAADVTRRAVGFVGSKVAGAFTAPAAPKAIPKPKPKAKPKAKAIATATPMPIEVEDRSRRPRADSGNGDKKPTKTSRKDREMALMLQSVEEEEEGGATEAPKFNPSTSSHDDGVKVKASTGYPSKTAGIKSEKMKPSTKASTSDEEKEKASTGYPSKTTGIKKESGVKRDTGLTKQKTQQPSGMIPPSKMGIQKLREAFEDAKNKNKLTAQDISTYMILYDDWREAKGKDNQAFRNEKVAKLRELYKKAIYKQ